MNLIRLGDDTESLVLGINFPKINSGKTTYCDFGKYYKKVGIKLPTQLLTTSSDRFFKIDLQILGFGIYLYYKRGI